MFNLPSEFVECISPFQGSCSLVVIKFGNLYVLTPCHREVGMLVVDARLWKRRAFRDKSMHCPMISFIIPAYNQEKQISRCIATLFEYAAHGPCLSEVIVVDDGSTDHTYEIAWAAVEVNREKWRRVGGEVVRYSTNLGEIQAVRTGANKAMGLAIAVVSAGSSPVLAALSELVPVGKLSSTGYVRASEGDDELKLGILGLYEVSVLREVLNRANMSLLRKVKE